MELGKGAWTDREEDYRGLREQFFNIFSRMIVFFRYGVFAGREPMHGIMNW